MNMCLLKVAMLEKCKSSHFQSKGGSKKFEYWGVKKIVGLGGTFTVCVCVGGGSVPHYMPCVTPLCSLNWIDCFKTSLLILTSPGFF